MSLEDDIKILSQVSFFEDLDGDQLRLLAFGAEFKSLFAGSELYLQDAPSDCGYVVISGLIDLTVNHGGVETILGSVEAYGVVGEIALITDNMRPTNAVARRDSKLFCIPRVLFMRMLEKYPQTAYRLHQKISRSVRLTVSQLDRIRVDLENQAAEHQTGIR